MVEKDEKSQELVKASNSLAALDAKCCELAADYNSIVQRLSKTIQNRDHVYDNLIKLVIMNDSFPYCVKLENGSIMIFNKSCSNEKVIIIHVIDQNAKINALQYRFPFEK